MQSFLLGKASSATRRSSQQLSFWALLYLVSSPSNIKILIFNLVSAFSSITYHFFTVLYNPYKAFAKYIFCIEIRNENFA